MTEQTEQEPIDPIAQCIRWLSFMVVNQEDRRMVQAELESIAAQVRERDAQIARLSAELVEQRVIGHGEGQQHTIDDVNAGRIDPLIAPRLDTLRAERDAAQQERDTMESAWKAAADQARKQILETAEWRKKAKAAQAVADALHASEARIYPDVAFEQYLDDTIGSLVDVVEDRANNGDEHGAAAIRQAVEAIGHLRRTRDELRRDMEHLGLAALSTRPQEQP